MKDSSSSKPPQESPFASLVLNVLVPVIVLTTLSGDDRLGPVTGLIVALSFPIGYGLYDLARRRRFNFISTVGIIGVLLTGGIGLLKLDVQWVAIKEAGVPLVIGLAILISLKTPFNLVQKLLGQIIDMKQIEDSLRESGHEDAFQRHLTNATYIIASSFFISAVLNYILAKIIVVSPAGTPEFNQELGKMAAISFPVIAIPSILLLAVTVYYLLSRISEFTGVDIQRLMRKT